MRNKGYTVRKKPAAKTGSAKSVDEMLKEVMIQASQCGVAGSYREKSLKIHGLICAKCAREFDYNNQHLLTVHHRDGNPNNNPPDGSNWENLCVYCHDDEHSRELLADYFNEKK